MPTSDFDDRARPAPHTANYYPVAPAPRSHDLKSRHTLPPFDPGASSPRFPLRRETWPILQPTLSAPRPPPPTLPPLPSIIPSSAMGRDARGASPEQSRSPTSSPYQSHAVPRQTTLPPLSSLTRGSGSALSPASAAGLPRLPPILQVEKQQVTTSATQAASASRRRNEAHFVCPVPGCGSTFTRRFNLRGGRSAQVSSNTALMRLAGHLRSHTAERPFLCEWPGCNKGFARQHDCKCASVPFGSACGLADRLPFRRHQALHTAKAQANVCQGCGKTFSRLDALNVRSRPRPFPRHFGLTVSVSLTEAPYVCHRRM